jgi:hypothetical protein
MHDSGVGGAARGAGAGDERLLHILPFAGGRMQLPPLGELRRD